MLGFSNIFSALRRLAASIHRTADLWDAANQQLEQRLKIDVDDDERPVVAGNGRRLGKGVGT